MISYMPWGKFKYRSLTEIPSAYLHWVAEKADFTDPMLRASVIAELRRRGENVEDAEGTEDNGRGVAPTSVIKEWYREMAMTFHPDRRLDDGKAMAAINHAYERLREMFGITTR
jgi:hypothetical protein